MSLSPRIAFRRRACCRTLSSYSPKVRAYPFAISAPEAVAELALCPAIQKGLFNRLLTRLGINEPLKPEKIVPVYFPAWFIDAEVEFNATIPTDNGTVDGRMTAVFWNSYLPGHTMDKLSRISFLSTSLALREPVPFSSELETQHGMKITCLPFKTVPFSVLDFARSMRPGRFVVSNIGVDPSSINPNLIGAYPVLFPLYLAQYAWDSDEDAERVHQTVLIEAHDKSGRIIAEFMERDEESEGGSSLNTLIPPPLPPPPPGLENSAFLKTLYKFEKRLRRNLEEAERKAAAVSPDRRYSQEEDMTYYRGAPSPFCNIATMTLPTRWHIPDLEQRTWSLERFVTAEGLQQLAAVGKVNMDDPRVRPFTPEERREVRKFFVLGRDRSQAYNWIEGISQVNTTGIEGNARQTMQKYAASFDTLRKKATPSWWKEWQDSDKTE